MDGNDVVVYIRGINLIYADDGDKTYYHFNAHGDVVVLTNSNGSKTKSYSYNAFGVEYNEATLDDNPFRYCGEYYDKETKTIYLRARYYDSAQGRFTQEDPIRDGYNWYAYCNSNPLMFVDPTGLVFESMVNTFMDKTSYTMEDQEQIYTNNEIKETDNADQNDKNDISSADSLSVHPKDVPPDHPDFKPPKKGNKRVKNPNGKGTGWQSNDGGVWVWTPGMHGGDGWTIQYPDGYLIRMLIPMEV